MTLTSQPMILSGRGVTAVLGPTNTGKTHYAIERMVAHGNGMIGLPLRLLAREVYTRLVEKVGIKNVALFTGEEKIAPPNACYSVCTVEAMPRETRASFVAIDEVQLAGDLERGHIFTDRILHLRGRDETLLLGAGTMRPILEHLLPGITVVERPRLSHLAYAGQKKITRLPQRSAIVAFSADEVYAIAELIRRQRGGAAVVLGALSPRTRNAQVELYQNGDVEYLVATDAIGMGLNLDVDHVAFAQDRKFDGYQFRHLNPGELGQIAGRAGRHLRDGTFGVTGQVDPFDADLVRRIESHQFDNVKVLQWRTKDLDFSSVAALKLSLDAPPRIHGLTRSLPSVDQQALEQLTGYPEVARLAVGRANVEKLWEACALPDYRRITPAQHADLISSLFSDLVQHGTVNEDFMAEQVRRADRTDGEIDTLSARIAQIRTWTYVSNRPGWLADPTHWQEKTREIEDRLSDALHERLTNRFVDRRTSVLMKRLRENAMLEAEISVNGDVFVEGHHVGQLTGFRFSPIGGTDGPDAKAVQNASLKALGLEFEARAARIHAAGNGDLAIGSDGSVRWLGDPVARLTGSDHIMRPRVILLADEQLTGHAREHVAARIERFVNHHISTVLKPLDDLSRAEDLQGLAKGLAFQVVENLGVLFRRDVTEEVKSLDQDARASMRRYGIRFGAYHIFVPALLKPAPAELITLLWALKNDGIDKPGYGDLIPVLAAGRTSVVTDSTYERTFYKLAGFRFLGKRAVRIDILERLADLIRPLLQWKPGQPSRPDGAYDGRRFTTTTAMLSILGATLDDMEEILKGLGYRADAVPAEEAAIHLSKQDATPVAATNVLAPVDGSSTPHPETAEAEAAVATQSEAVAETVAEVSAAVSEDAPVAEPEAAKDVAPESAAEAAVTDVAPSKAAAEGAPVDAVAAEPPKPVLLWRLGGRNDNQRPAPRQGERRGQQGPRAGQDQANAQPNTNRRPSGDQPQGEGNREARDNRGGPRGGKDGGGGRPPQQQGKRPDHRGGERNERNDRGGERNDRNNRPAAQPTRFEAKPPRKEKPMDPDSPFAKLAALKEQMKK
ncbi:MULTISPECIES: helicase-related protein [Rhizobium]|uniref:Helicase-related protein n=1 Tax=Rhizobium rhododendri TaxID=2506430 RepID=A0ABY8IHJ4_9HYPH|nr:MULTISPECIES: helicase-related protein [Rhizobium]MBO9100253.1 helicase [Rhizobium sp. L58/93]MBO9135590.1 helicase [Rhizobium sp. B209b/85]MBO9186146.1 helicase [Rhizobium sp. E27B/91]MBZ5760718.1 helicase [Rhizobium sp. VS19-DR96]MBZ5765498.1 helicase [Rhizobium sp. VS19-DR129.2]